MNVVSGLSGTPEIKKPVVVRTEANSGRVRPLGYLLVIEDDIWSPYMIGRYMKHGNTAVLQGIPLQLIVLPVLPGPRKSVKQADMARDAC